MPDFRKVQHADASPTQCFLCGNHEGPFIDTAVQRDPLGHVWICASTENRIGCVRQMGRLDGLHEPVAVAEIRERLELALGELQPTAVAIFEHKLEHALRATATIEKLMTELASSKLVPALEVFELGRKEGERGVTPLADPDGPQADPYGQTHPRMPDFVDQ